jgi:hypothetical protein
MLGPQGYVVQGSSASFNVEASDRLVSLVLLAAIWLIGLAAIASGWTMIAKGRRSEPLYMLMLLPGFVIVVIVGLILGGFVLQG